MTLLIVIALLAPAYVQGANEAPPKSAASALSPLSGYPKKPIRFICPFPPGGAADMVTRMLAQRLTDVLKEQTVVDNRGGAGGVIGVQLAGKSAADGYTLLLASSSNFAFGPA